MSNVYLERSLVYGRQEELRREVQANNFAKRQRADRQMNSHVQWAGLSFPGLRRLLLG